jgi:hypothetical protein
MNQPPAKLGIWQTGRFMYIAGVVILVAVALYFLFMVVDGQALPEEKSTATVIGKGFREAGRTYYTQIIDNRPVIIPQAKPEMYLLKLDIGGRETEGAVTKDLYEAVKAADQVRVTYQRRRLSGALQVVQVDR